MSGAVVPHTKGHPRQVFWEFDISSGRFMPSDELHVLLGDPNKTLQLTLSTIMETLHPAYLGALKAAWKRMLLAGAHLGVESRLTGLDSKERTLWITGARLLGADEKPVRAFGIVQDVTGLEHSEAVLREREDHYRHAVELDGRLHWTADPQGNTLEVPQQWQSLTGLSHEECLGKGWAQALHPDDLDAALSAWEEPRRLGSPYTAEHRVRVVDGSYRWFRARAIARRAENGEIVRWYGTVEDIHEQKCAEIALRDSEAALRKSEAALRESEAHYRHAVELSPVMSWVEDAEGNTLEVSNRWFELTGLPVEDSLGRGWTERLHPEDLLPTERTWQYALQSGEPYDVEHRVRVADGTYRWFRSRAKARKGENGQIFRWYGSVEDIHDRKTAEIALRESEAALRESEAFASSILDGTEDCIEVIDLRRRLRFMNRSCRQLMELYGFSVAPGQDWMDMWPDDLREKAADAFERARSGATIHLTNSGLTLEGTMGFWDVTMSPILGPTGQPDRILSVSRDITPIKIAQDELERSREAAEVAARQDSMTGLLNRPAFREELAQQLMHVNGHSQTAVLFLDLDDFKSVNDSLGHPAGDELLREAGRRLRTCLRGTDQIARFGGDEFAILQTAVVDAKQAEGLAQRIVDRLRRPYLLERREVVAGVSIGIALADNPTVEADELLKQADIALYRAKHAGKSTYEFFEPGMDEAAEENQRLRSELREAAARDELRVFYQPIVEFDTSRITGFEALLRWQHPRRGLLMPSEFITLAEETGDIEEIGTWALRQACLRAASWPDEISVSVNLSPRQFKDPRLMQSVSQTLSESGLNAGRLVIEITESVLLQDDRVVSEALAAMRARGIRISIDDFGTGYSSLGYLQKFTIDNIKIDRSFVIDLAENERTSAILQALMVLSRELGVSLTAEGIETSNQLERLKAIGCRRGQGYLFSPPMPADAAEAFLLTSERTMVADRIRVPHPRNSQVLRGQFHGGTA